MWHFLRKNFPNQGSRTDVYCTDNLHSNPTIRVYVNIVAWAITEKQNPISSMISGYIVNAPIPSYDFALICATFYSDS